MVRTAELETPPQLPPGDRAVRFINNLTHTKGEWAGQPFHLRPWQEEIIRRLFGTIRNNRRQYRTCYVEVPRKNGKSELAAAIAMYLLFGDKEQGAEIYSAAVDRDQASLVFNVAAQMVRNDKALVSMSTIIDSRRNIAVPTTNSFYRAIPADAAGRHGYNAHGIIYDEIHAAPNRELYDVLSSSTGARRQPLTFIITTAGFDRRSICWELHEYSKKILDGVIEDDSWLPVLYSAPEDADWQDPAVWHRYNPALGDFRSLEEMEIAARRAREAPGQQNAFRRLYLCQWTEQETRWLDMDVWRANEQPVDAAALKGQPCYAGLDLSSTTDLSALELYFPQSSSWLHYYFLPEEMPWRPAQERESLRQWAEQGYLTVTPGPVVDYNYIREKLNQLVLEGYNIREIGADPWNATQLLVDLQGDGFTCFAVRQGYASLSAPTKQLEALLLARKLRLGDNPVTRWAASNVVVEQDASGNLKPSKAKSSDRIDPIVAMVLALDRAIRHEEQEEVEGNIFLI